MEATCEVTIVDNITSISLSEKLNLVLGLGGFRLNIKETPDFDNFGNNDATWESSKTEVATVDKDGIVTPVSVGTTTITAEFNGMEATCEVTIVDNITSISFSQEKLTLTLGGYGLLLSIKVTPFSSNFYSYDATWTSSKPDVATINENGHVTPVSVGTTTITAEFNGMEATCEVTVVDITSISLSQEKLTLVLGGNDYSLSIKEKSDCDDSWTGMVTWQSSKPEVATVSKSGTVTPVTDGTTTITAEFNGMEATCEVTVVDITSISLSKETVSFALGTENYVLKINNIQEYDNIYASNIKWNSSKPEVATVSISSSDFSGIVTPVSVGTTTITAEFNGMEATCEVTITASGTGGTTTVPVTGISIPETLSLKVGGSSTLNATIEPSNATNRTVTWSSDSDVVSVDQSGKVTAKKAGTAKITVKTVDGNKTATCTVTVTASGTSGDDTADVPVTGIALSKSSLNLSTGKGFALTATVTPSNATDKTVKWLSNNLSVAKVSNDGYVTAVGIGEAWITARIGDVYARCIVTVTGTGSTTISVTGLTLDKTNLSLKTGSSSKLNVTVNPTNATNQNVYWSSNDSSVVSVDQEGNIKALKSGTATITVNSTSDTSKYASCTITVTDEEVEESNVSVTGISLKDTKITLNINGQYQLAPTITPSNATNQSAIWNSSDESVATVTNGIVNALKEGSATITVTTVDGSKTATCNVTVTSNYADVTLSNINTLSSLDLGEFKIDFFSPETLTYNVTVPSTVNSITIDSMLTDVKSKYVEGYGNRIVSLNNTDNVVLIKIEAENGDVRTYTLNIKRSSDIKNLVSNITIDGYKINFKNSVKEYDLKIKNEKFLDINVTLTDNKYTYNILNNEDLVDGKVIIIKAIGDNMVEEYRFNISTSNINVPITSLDSPTIILIGSIVLGIIGFGIIYFTKLRRK